ncbi:PEP-CTERM sorting domain-containing protein [Prosthecobacter sp.]|uniref:PEP-CTERM sorting domain-containing protein n=1 Tax=Prosthecobacter sp. TaxID=1965333 RepID=UPI00248A0870|nr:PEP-CTERM sorting domain-containing protein [Prosthecobacter sp.]MDI1311212.1 PEP-CTERM sorting domain-containing protein [Prosthecobacter sp.]
MPVYRLLLLCAALALPFGTAQALTWVETANGDLSGDGGVPTLLGDLSLGSNLISGTMGAVGGVGPVDADVWNFTIAAGYYLTGINLTSFSSASGNNSNSFMAIDDGGSINMGDASLHLSNNLFSNQVDGFGNTHTDLLALMIDGPFFGGTGFDGPLPEGNYTFWIQEGGDQINYSIDFVTSLTPVPEPGSLLLLGVAGLWWLRRRR